MSPTRPFFDTERGIVDDEQILSEAIPLAKLVAFFGVIALVPFGLAFVFFGNSIIAVFLGFVGQFVLAIGTGVVLLYVIARGIQLAGVDVET